MKATKKPKHVTPGAAIDRQPVIAWAGWTLFVRADWRPLKIEGGQHKGSMMIGDGGGPILLVQWWRPSADPFDPSAWLKRRFRKLGAVPSEDAPSPPGFEHTAWVENLAMRENTFKTSWYGYSVKAALMLEITVTSLADSELRDEIFHSRVSALAASAGNEPQRWSVYSADFLSPPGFELQQKRLCSGDIALLLARGRQGVLLMRQVYPAGLALARRSRERWLAVSPFTERRKMRSLKREKWQSRSRPELEGLQQEGVRRLPAPLGGLSSRRSTAVVAVDRKLDRLLISELQTRKLHGAAEVQWVIEHMNGASGAVR